MSGELMAIPALFWLGPPDEFGDRGLYGPAGEDAFLAWVMPRRWADLGIPETNPYPLGSTVRGDGIVVGYWTEGPTLLGVLARHGEQRPVVYLPGELEAEAA